MNIFIFDLVLLQYELRKNHTSVTSFVTIFWVGLYLYMPFLG